MSQRFQQYPFLLICTMLAGCASTSSTSEDKKKDAAAAEHIARLEDKIVELETRLTALNDKINLEENEKPASAKPVAKAAPATAETELPTEKIQPPAAKNKVIPRSNKPQSKFAESFQQDEATDRYREAKILFESNRPSDAILEFSDFVKDNPRHVLAPNAQYYIGMGYLQQKEYKLAEEELSRVLINYPHSNAIPDTLAALVKVSGLLQKPARVTYFQEKLNSHFANSPQAKTVAAAPVKKAEDKPVAAPVETPHLPETPAAPKPQMETGEEPSVVR